MITDNKSLQELDLGIEPSTNVTEVSLSTLGNVPDLIEGGTKPAVRQDVLSFRERPTQGSDLIPFLNDAMTPLGKTTQEITKFGVDLLQGLVGVPAGLIDSIVEARANQFGVPNENIPQLKRLVAGLQYEGYEKGPLGIPYGTGQYIGENPGTAAGFSAALTQPFVAAQKALGKKIKTNQEKYDDFVKGKIPFGSKKDVKIKETSPGVYQAQPKPLVDSSITGLKLRDRAAKSLGQPFANHLI